MTEAESKVLLKEYGAYCDAIEKGTLVSNKEAAKDVTWTVETIYDEVSGFGGAHGTHGTGGRCGN
jgi:hypothetical protein